MTDVVVAPRELADLVTACCRVAGIDPGTAARVANNVLAAELAFNTGTDQFASALFDGEQPLASSPFFWASDRLIDAELETRQHGRTTAELPFTQPVPIAAIWGTVQACRSRGVTFPALEVPPSTNPVPSTVSIESNIFDALKRHAGKRLVPETEVDSTGAV